MESQGFIFHIQEKGLNGYDFFYHQLNPVEYCIGRGLKSTSFSSIQVQLQDQTVSRNHCRIFFNQSSGWMVEDLGSKNGTWLEEGSPTLKSLKKIIEPTAIKDGSILRVGETTIRLWSLSRVGGGRLRDHQEYAQISA
ncbi:MAG: FHA domain-containing protein [Magnetococcales bacterium]|nr:FHA domain-containing protein [Magnetococcales bacterium]